MHFLTAENPAFFQSGRFVPPPPPRPFSLPAAVALLSRCQYGSRVGNPAPVPSNRWQINNGSHIGGGRRQRKAEMHNMRKFFTISNTCFSTSFFTLSHIFLLLPSLSAGSPPQPLPGCLHVNLPTCSLSTECHCRVRRRVKDRNPAEISAFLIPAHICREPRTCTPARTRSHRRPRLQLQLAAASVCTAAANY